MADSNKTVKVDRIDLKILGALQADARMTNQALSERVGLSPSPCLQRVKRLEQAGVISGYLGRIAIARLAHGIGVIATASLVSHDQGEFAAFETAVADIPELVECFKVSGPFDYFLRFICTDVASYEQISDDLLKRGPEGMKLSSHVVLRETKAFEGVPLDRLVSPEQ